MNDPTDAEKDPGTYAWHLYEHWKAFNSSVDAMLMGDTKMNRYKFREYMLWDMQRRHEMEVPERSGEPGNDLG
jgi:hypothetical protein